MNQANSINNSFGITELISSEKKNTSKEDYVCGVFVGIDLCNYIQILFNNSSLSLKDNQLIVYQLYQARLKFLEPFIALNYQKGQFLIGTSFGVRSEYENLKIGQTLANLFVQNALKLGYSLTAGITINPASSQRVTKQNQMMLSYIDLTKQNLPEEVIKILKSKKFLLYGCLIQKNTPHIKIPESFLKPNL
ncbi:hypothetical protein ABPG72_021273 [Tetrahymena utriculariae]